MTQNEAISKGAAIIREGGIIAYPTEYCFGLGCDPRNRGAIKRILNIKRRHWSKGIILVADSYMRFNRYLKPTWDEIASSIDNSWPGPNTWLIPARKDVTHWIRGCHENLAVRVSANRTIRQLVRAADMAILSTSANRAGQRPLRTAAQTNEILASEIDFVMPIRVGNRLGPSTIRDLASGKILRGDSV